MSKIASEISCGKLKANKVILREIYFHQFKFFVRLYFYKLIAGFSMFPRKNQRKFSELNVFFKYAFLSRIFLKLIKIDIPKSSYNLKRYIEQKWVVKKNSKNLFFFFVFAGTGEKFFSWIRIKQNFMKSITI